MTPPSNPALALMRGRKRSLLPNPMMRLWCYVSCVVLVSIRSISASGGANPLATVLKLLDDISAKVKQEAQAETKSYKEYFDWCDTSSADGRKSVESLEAEQKQLEADVDQLASSIEQAESKIAKFISEIASTEKKSDDAKKVRDSEHREFTTAEEELNNVITTLGSAVSVLKQQTKQQQAVALAQMASNGDLAHVVDALSVVIDAASFTSADRDRFEELVQLQEGSSSEIPEENGDGRNAESPPVYESHSGSIINTMEDLRLKGEKQLSDLREAENTAKNNYELLKASLDKQIETKNIYMTDEKTFKSESEQSKATKEGDLNANQQGLTASKASLETIKANCLTVASDHEESVRRVAEELRVLHEATVTLQETSGGAVQQTYTLLQASSHNSHRARASASSVAAEAKAIAMVKELARRYHSAALAQLVSRLSTAQHFTVSAREDPFAKVKGLIQGLITKLQKEAEDEAGEKKFCDHELSKTSVKKVELEQKLGDLTSKIDQAAADSAQLEEEIKVAQLELKNMVTEKMTMTQIRQESHAAFVKGAKDLQEGLAGVRTALVVLRDYYAQGDEGSEAFLQQDDDSGFTAMMQQPVRPTVHTKSAGGNSIIGILEVIASDFATDLAHKESEEDGRQERYEKLMQKQEVAKAAIEQDVKYKTKELTTLRKATTEFASDQETAGTEQAAVLEYDAKLRARCVAKPETYEERRDRRKAEIAGLREALAVLRGEELLQRGSRRIRVRAASKVAQSGGGSRVLVTDEAAL